MIFPQNRLLLADRAFFPSCQVRGLWLVDFLSAGLLLPLFLLPLLILFLLVAGLQLQARDPSVPRWTRTANSGSGCSPPDLNCKCQIAVFQGQKKCQKICRLKRQEEEEEEKDNSDEI